MRKLLYSFALIAILALTTPTAARMIAPPSIAERVAAAQLVVAGKVTGFGEKLIPGERFKGDTGQLQTATIEVKETLAGTAGKKITVGYNPPAAGGRPPIRRYPTVQLQRDQEVILMLVKHPTKKDLYLVQNYYDVVAQKDNAAQVAAVKKYTKLLADPKKGLESKVADDRYATAAMLIVRYRTPVAGATKTKPVAADLSKRILTILSEADWTKSPPELFRMNAQAMFARLGVTDKDGWKQPTDFNKFNDEAKKWLKDNAGKYRIQAFTAPEEKTTEPRK